jgi:outer membrane biosynthesis protein TonB
METCPNCGKKIVPLDAAMQSCGGPAWWCLCPLQAIAEPVFLNEEPPVEDEALPTEEPTDPAPDPTPEPETIPEPEPAPIEAPALTSEEGVQ